MVGFNGMGKTSLLRLLAGQQPLSAGKRRVGHKVVIGYQSQEFADTMPMDQSVFRVVKDAQADTGEQEVRTLLGSFGFSADTVYKSVGVLSGGEKIRLAFARMFIQHPSFLILDEPTTHLDLQAREALEQAIKEYTGTVCFVSHDIAFVRNVADSIVAITPEGVTRYAGDYVYYQEKSRQVDGHGGSSERVAAKKRSAGKKPGSGSHKETQKNIPQLKKKILQLENKIEKQELSLREITEQLQSAASRRTAGGGVGP